MSAGMPDEPRQKMINVMYLVLTAILALNVSNEVITAFKVVDKSLLTSNELINEGSETVLKSLESKVEDPETAERAKLWEPKAKKARELSTEIYNYIDGLKQQLKEQSGLRKNSDGTVWVNENGEEDFREDNLDASTNLFDKNGLGKELEKKLNDYKEAMLALDPDLKKHFGDNFPVSTDTKGFKDSEGKQMNFTRTYFYMTPAISAITMLSKFQNNIRSAESESINFFHNQVGAVKIVYDQFAPIVGMSSNYVMPGDKIVVTAGVGAFSSQSLPSITIGGQNVSVGPDGLAEYTISASGQGVHQVPVQVTYTKPDGTKETKPFPLEYTVGTPGGSAVMLDKMNVFYRGVDNPITISSGTGWDKTKVSMSGGTLVPAGGAGHYKVKVTSLGTANITVNADGKVNTYSFRIKDVPDPILMIGPSDGGRVQSVVFKNQRFARAELKDFIYDYHYKIVGATVYFGGANFENMQTATINSGDLGGISALMGRCGPGTMITFDNVKVQGENGGPVKSIPGVGFTLY